MKRILNTMIMFLAVMAVAGLLVECAVAAGITVYKKDDKYVKLGGRIHLQYHLKDPDGAKSTDKVFFRRLRPYIEGSLHKDWKAKFQWDMGKAEGSNEVAIKDAYFQYKGFKNLKITIGNAYFPFSREDMTSSKKTQLVERTFVGDHNYGSPERNAGLHLTGHLPNKKVAYGLSFASASIDPDDDKLDFDTPVNRNSDFNEGWIVGGRVDFYPFGLIHFAQGDLGKKEKKVAIGLAGFNWKNDDENNTYTTAGVDTSSGKKPDVDRVTGFEVSGAVRFIGFSLDAEFNTFNVETEDRTVTSGIYKNGDTTLKNFAVEGGYMIIKDRLELVAGYEWQDADNYAEEWTRASFGTNLFIKKHDIKIQLTYRIGNNLKGVDKNDENELFLQFQYVF